jgi:S1-C subfamily serine protease
LLGYTYTKKMIDEEDPTMLGLRLHPSDEGGIIIAGFAEGYEDYGLQQGDVIVKIFGEEVNFTNARDLLDRADTMNVGDEFSITVKRGGEELEFTGRLFQRYKRHVFGSKKVLTDEESRLRNAWLKNL